MTFHKNILYTLISAATLITTPAFSMHEEEPTGAFIPVALNTDDVDTGVDLNILAGTYTHLRSAGNAASDSDLVKYLLEEKGYKGWSALNSTQQTKLISKVSGKPMEVTPPPAQPSSSSASSEASGQPPAKENKESKGICTIQ